MKLFPLKEKSKHDFTFLLREGILVLLKKKNRFFLFFQNYYLSETIHNQIQEWEKKKFEVVKILFSKKDLEKELKFYSKIPQKFVKTNPLQIFVTQTGAFRFSKKKKIKIFVLDDSKSMRELIKQALSQEEAFEIIGESEDPLAALKEVQVLKPDFITVDIHMPLLNGVEFLKKLAPKIPSIVVSSLSFHDGNYVIQALEAGALDYIQKPSHDKMGVFSKDLGQKIKNLKSAQQRIVNQESIQKQRGNLKDHFDLILVGSSTGGTEALKTCFQALPEEFPPIVIAQHLPEHYTKAFADYLSDFLKIKVVELTKETLLEDNQIYVIQGGKNAIIQKKEFFQVQIEIPEKNGFIPSANRLFESGAALNLKERLGTIVLTGMGSDGAQGASLIAKAQGRVLIQSEETCVVYGMPKAVAELGIAEKSLAPEYMISYFLKTDPLQILKAKSKAN